MAINSIEVPCDKTVSQGSLNHYTNHLPDNILADELSEEENSRNINHKILRQKKKLDLKKSPYLTEDSVQLLSRVTEKRLIHKKGSHVSSSPLSNCIYNANSNDFKGMKKNGRKALKSVLTPPTDPKSALKLCPVNYENGSDDDEEDLRKITKKRGVPAHTRKCKSRTKGYDRDSQYCTDLDVHFDSSHDELKSFSGSKRANKTKIATRDILKEKVSPHDVWAMLRNMNRFQFRTSPQLSEDSFIMKNVIPKKRNNRKDLRVVETRRTEEFAYISSYKMESPSFSHCSSFDKVTVIDKKQNFKLNLGHENKIPKKKKSRKHGPRSTTKSIPKPKTPILQHNNFKALTYVNPNRRDVTEKASEDLTKLKCLDITTSVDLGYESKTTENDEDLIISENDTRDEISQYSVVYSDNSGSSKAAFLKQTPHKKEKDRSLMADIDERGKQINGITKVTLGKFHNAETQHNANKIETMKKNHHSSESRVYPSNTPKLTKTEINRQLSKYRFPIMVLGKDQLRSTIHVVNAEHPQFNGLDERMWPFMTNWYGVERPPNPIRKQHDSQNKGFNESERKRLWHNNTPKQKLKEAVKLDRKHTTLPLPKSYNMNTQNFHVKAKPIQQITDRMLELLYKNTALRAIDESHSLDNKKDKSPRKVNIGTGIQLDFNYYGDSTSPNDNYTISTAVKTKDITSTRNPFVRKHDYSTSSDKNNSMAAVVTSKNTATTIKSYVKKQSWAKAKWANDFIENVMKKVGSGVYYNKANKLMEDNITLPLNIKEEGVQTESNSSEEFTNTIIPGFDDVVPEIEIKTMNMNEVSVKHCVTNIILHFDVIVPAKPMVNVGSTSLLVPVSINKSLTKVFKSQISILNAMLPAELCSILPKMINNIIESREHLTFFTPTVEQISCLSTITEVPTRCEHASVTEIVSVAPTNLLSTCILPPLPMPLRPLLHGRFNKVNNTSAKFHVTSIPLKYYGPLVEDLKPHLSRAHLFDCNSNLILPLQMTKKICNIEEESIIPRHTSMTSEKQQINTCTALQLYKVGDDQSLIGSIGRVMHLAKILGSMKTLMNNVGLWIVGMSSNYMSINTKIDKMHKLPNTITLTMSNSSLMCFKNSSIYLNLMKTTSTLPDLGDKIIRETPNNLLLSLCCQENHQLDTIGPFQNDYSSVNIIKPKRKRLSKLYRKSKSASSIYGAKATPLARIDNIDDFFQMIGPAKLLASVFDDQSSFKIMSSIKEMKNWTTEINAKQALLLFLLSNKKDTPNLVRYRPVILQGIAVNRITKVQELDMEIEVIETENLHGISRYEGISYLPASIENQDSLYEELCWIAKTTASDYQKPFNQTSERLLRSLLEKRKKLNPSYLRVMARYVGLGLLKTQGKKYTF